MAHGYAPTAMEDDGRASQSGRMERFYCAVSIRGRNNREVSGLTLQKWTEHGNVSRVEAIARGHR